ncbi:unnamed protein product, partial [Larinioides sclopetarius]
MGGKHYLLISSFSMEGMKILALAFVLCGFQFYTAQCKSCTIEKNVNGTIAVGENTYSRQKCWAIPVPFGHFIQLQLKNMYQSGASCQKENVKINIAGTSDVYQFCISDSNTNPITAFDNVTITHYVSTNYYRYTGFTLEYAIKTIECLNRNSFECDNDTCVSEDRVCDGVKDCKNRADEIGCERVYQRSPGGERGGRVLVET